MFVKSCLSKFIWSNVKLRLFEVGVSFSSHSQREVYVVHSLHIEISNLLNFHLLTDVFLQIQVHIQYFLYRHLILQLLVLLFLCQHSQ